MKKHVKFGSSEYGLKAFKDRYAQYEGETIEDVWRRVAKFAASDDGAYGWSREEQEEKFYWIMSEQLFSPAGRILSNCGGTGNGNPGNCFGLPLDDSRESIMDTLANFAEIAAHGGGIGINFSNLRPAGDEVKGARSVASGPCSFIDVFQSMGSTIKQGGSRGLAAIAILNVDHPEIEKFIARKSESDDIWNNFNVSVGITDDFMDAVENGETWDLKFDGKVYDTVDAIELWEKIASFAHKSGEPGVVFLDTVNELSPINYATTFETTNPCGELPSITRDENGNPQAGMCCLGSLVFPNFYDEEDGYNLDLLGKVIEIAVLMLDNLIENGNYPIALNEETMKAYRPIGIGGLGLADLLFLNKIKYGDDESTLFMQELLCDIENLAYSSSKKLAKELGPFPKYDKDKDVCGGPRRNSTLISFAPTGTISALYGASWGIEPYYAVSMTRNEELGKATTGFTVLDNWRKEHPKEPWPSYLSVVKSGNEDIQELTVQDHLYMLSTIALFADNSISKTVNLPHDATVTDVMEAYEFCWRNEIKGCTVYREGCRSVNAVEVEGADYSEQDEEDYDIEFVDLVAQPREIPVEASASRYKLKYNPEKPSLYLTLTDDGHGPLEIFFNTMDAQAKETLDGMALSITSLFRRGIDARHLLEKYKRYESPNGGGWYKGKYVPSLLAGVAMVVEDHFTKMGYLTDEAYLKQLETENMSDSGKIEGERCPNCGMYTLIPVEGCVMCTSCGYSKCG